MNGMHLGAVFPACSSSAFENPVTFLPAMMDLPALFVAPTSALFHRSASLCQGAGELYIPRTVADPAGNVIISDQLSERNGKP